MKIYNSYTLKTEEFKPIVEGEVSMYVCGPTVYNHAHIGNARPIVVFDTLRRVFEQEGYKVRFVSNFTDVDDKIINKAIDEAVEEAKQRGIHGKATTPFLLARIKELTGGDSLESNIQLVYNNARLAAKTAVALRDLER